MTNMEEKMIYKRTFFALWIMILLLSLVACPGDNAGKKVNKDENKPHYVNATILILGHHANSMKIDDSFYNNIRKHIESSVYGGYIGTITTEGTPRIIRNHQGSMSFNDLTTLTPAQNANDRKRDIQSRTELVLLWLKTTDIRATSGENDLLKAIDEARRLFREFEVNAQTNGRELNEKRLVIMDTGIVTTGEMNFAKRVVTDGEAFDEFEFRNATRPDIEQFTAKIANTLYDKMLIPDLSGVEVLFIGINNVAPPQLDLHPLEQFAVKSLWKSVFAKANTTLEDANIYEFASTGVYNNMESGYPVVSPIVFFADEGVVAPVTFIKGTTRFTNEAQARTDLRGYAEKINRYFKQNNNARLYVVGSESWENKNKVYTTNLSEARAARVLEILTGLGVDPKSMLAFGLHIEFPNRENEWATGEYDVEIGERNQKIQLVFSDSEFAEKIRTVRTKLYSGKRFDF